MNEVMARLYGITGNEDYLTAAKFFDNEKLFMPMERNVDTLGGMHANQHIPQVVGALRIYKETGDMRYYRIAKNFWDMVVSHHIYNIGGTGEGEMFRTPGKIGSYITDKTAETFAIIQKLNIWIIMKERCTIIYWPLRIRAARWEDLPILCPYVPALESRMIPMGIAAAMAPVWKTM